MLLGRLLLLSQVSNPFIKTRSKFSIQVAHLGATMTTFLADQYGEPRILWNIGRHGHTRNIRAATSVAEDIRFILITEEHERLFGQGAPWMPSAETTDLWAAVNSSTRRWSVQIRLPVLNCSTSWDESWSNLFFNSNIMLVNQFQLSTPWQQSSCSGSFLSEPRRCVY